MKRLVALVCVAALIGGLILMMKRNPSTVTVKNLRCEYRVNPLGIDETLPRLSWVLESPDRGAVQSAYRILVASSREKLDKGEGDLWDSGRVKSDVSNQIVYAGEKLTSGAMCWWKVCVWDGNGAESAFSAPALWSMGLLDDSEWKAQWIAMTPRRDWSKQTKREPGPPSPFLRKTFTADRDVKRATAYVTARGLFELYLNGKRVGEDVLVPGWTNYDKRIQYLTYDVTGLVADGDNAVGAVLGDGWYCGYVGWRQVRSYYGTTKSLLCRLDIEYADGRVESVVSDGSWKCSHGPIVYSDMMMGEKYDAGLELNGWNTASYDDTAWEPVMTVAAPAAALVAKPSQPVRVTEHVPSVGIEEPVKGVYVFDLGQNIAGWARLRVNGPKGTVVTMRFAERLNPDGTVYTTNLRSAEATDIYVLKGGGEEVYEPRFTFHGFQYVEVSGYPGTPDLDTITGCVVHNATPPVGSFECSSELINKLYSNICWGQRGNFISIPTDCPQRDERLGWMGDAQIFVRSATFNMDVSAFFTKWMDDVSDAQSDEGAFADFCPRLTQDERAFEAAPGWGDAGIVVPWTIYMTYGDTRMIERHWNAMEKWMDFLLAFNPDLIRRNRLGNNYGDWLSIKASTPKDLLATAYWAYDAKLMAEMAAVIGRDSDVNKYTKLFEDVRAAFQKEFVDADGRVYLVHGDKLTEKGFDASGTAHSENTTETQTNYVLALYMDLLPENLRAKAAEHLVRKIAERDNHLSTGFIGVRHLNPVLTDAGRNDLAYTLLLNETFPSWGYSIRQGATTIWERWDGWTEANGFQDPGMNSFNHYSLGSVSEWMFRYAAGIETDPSAPGYKRIILSPNPDRKLPHVKASYESIYGTIASAWRIDGDTFSLDVTIPANTTALVHVPADPDTEVSEGGKRAEKADGVTYLRYENGRAVFSVGSGSYNFASTVASLR